MRRILAAILAAVLGAAASAPTPAYETVPPPEKGQPYPGNKQCLPYEDVLDISDLVLAGTVKSFDGGKVKLAGVKVLRGKYDKAEAEAAYEGSFSEDDIAKDKPAVLLCLAAADGSLRLAGNPPKGAGLVAPGAELAGKLIEAAADPLKGYASEDAAVKFSSAYRLARGWAAAPAEKKPKLPAGIVETLLGGLVPDKLRDRNVNAAARDALNLLLNCDLNKQFGYSVNAPDWKREDKAGDVANAWRLTVKAVRARRKAAAAGGKPPEAQADFDLQRAEPFVSEEEAK